MLRRVKPVVLVGLIATLILSIALLADAKGGGREAALGTAMGEVGTPYGFGTDGPGTFSCTGLVRHALRSAGVDPNAPWDHSAYLGAYPTVSEPQPGDVVVYPDGVAMYIGGGNVVMANDADGVVGTYGMNEVGTPVGFANPYGDGAAQGKDGDGAAQGKAADPAIDDSFGGDPVIDDSFGGDPVIDDSFGGDPALEGDPTMDGLFGGDPALEGDPAMDGSFGGDLALEGDPMLGGSPEVDPAMAVDPLMP
jgi:hypothetical protein